MGADNEDVGEHTVHFAVNVRCCAATGFDDRHSGLDIDMRASLLDRCDKLGLGDVVVAVSNFELGSRGIVALVVDQSHRVRQTERTDCLTDGPRVLSRFAFGSSSSSSSLSSDFSVLLDGGSDRLLLLFLESSFSFSSSSKVSVLPAF
jgi:hypothetical protein